MLMLTPEPPYPLNGGGAFRIASLAHYFSQTADLDLGDVFRTQGKRRGFCRRGLVRSQTVIPLPLHSPDAGVAVLPQRAAGAAGPASAG